MGWLRDAFASKPPGTSARAQAPMVPTVPVSHGQQEFMEAIKVSDIIKGFVGRTHEALGSMIGIPADAPNRELVTLQILESQLRYGIGKSVDIHNLVISNLGHDVSERVLRLALVRAVEKLKYAQIPRPYPGRVYPSNVVPERGKALVPIITKSFKVMIQQVAASPVTLDDKLNVIDELESQLIDANRAECFGDDLDLQICGVIHQMSLLRQSLL